MNSIQIFIDEKYKSLNLDQLKSEMYSYYMGNYVNNKFIVKNMNTGIDIHFNSRGIKKQLNDVRSKMKLMLIPYLSKILKFASLNGLEPNKRNAKFLSLKFIGLLKIDGIFYQFNGTVLQDVNGNVLYDHFSSEIRNPNAGNSAIGSIAKLAIERQSSGFLEPKVQQLRQNAIG